MHVSKRQLDIAKAESRRKIEQQRVKVRQHAKGRPVGRPIRHSGTYYARHAMISDELWLKVNLIKMHGEPFGRALDRYVGMAEQKKLQAQLDEPLETSTPIEPAPIDNHFNDITSEYLKEIREDIRKRYYSK